MTKPGTKDWNDSAERSEWSFMAKMMREAAEFIPHRLSGLRVAIDIADARSKSGWRTAKDNDAASDQATVNARLREALDSIEELNKFPPDEHGRAVADRLLHSRETEL